MNICVGHACGFISVKLSFFAVQGWKKERAFRVKGRKDQRIVLILPTDSEVHQRKVRHHSDQIFLQKDVPSYGSCHDFHRKLYDQSPKGSSAVGCVTVLTRFLSAAYDCFHRPVVA